MNFYKRALELNEETVSNRRYLHQNAEIGLKMPIAQNYVLQKLKEYGLKPQKCGHGVSAILGNGSPVILLRADMDALPMQELSGESFACNNGKHAHTCGHDIHTAMLLTAAKMLKECEENIRGTVKFMFQPAEETLEGARDMIKKGILEDPHVDAALAFHVAAGKTLPGEFMFNSSGVMMSAVNGFRIEIMGKGGHVAYPYLAVDPIRIAVQIYIGLESLIAKEADPQMNGILTIGKIQSGNATNIIPDVAFLEGTLRTKDKECQKRLIGRISEISQSVAKIYGGHAVVTPLFQAPPLICSHDLTKQMARYMQEMNIPNNTAIPNVQANASEDFAFIAEAVPSTFMYLSAGFNDERGNYSAHNPRVLFNENVCPVGAAGFAHCAARWLEEHSI